MAGPVVKPGPTEGDTWRLDVRDGLWGCFLPQLDEALLKPPLSPL